MNETEKILREELQAMHEALSIIADNLTNDDGIDPEAWHLELTADEANLIRAVKWGVVPTRHVKTGVT